MYWFARQKCAANLRASESSDAKASVPKLWNSSMWAKNGTRFSGAWALRPIATSCRCEMRSDAEQIRGLLPYPAFGEVGDENAAVLHRVGKIEFRRVLAEDGAQRRRGGELPHFVENGAGRFGAIAVVVLRVLPASKTAP